MRRREYRKGRKNDTRGLTFEALLLSIPVDNARAVWQDKLSHGSPEIQQVGERREKIFEYAGS